MYDPIITENLTENDGTGNDSPTDEGTPDSEPPSEDAGTSAGEEDPGTGEGDPGTGGGEPGTGGGDAGTGGGDAGTGGGDSGDMPYDEESKNNNDGIKTSKSSPLSGSTYERPVSQKTESGSSPSVKAANDYLEKQHQMISNIQLESQKSLGDLDANNLNVLNAQRQNALKNLQNQWEVESTLRPKLQVEDQLVSNVEDELGKTRKLFDNKNAYFSFRRQTEINNYYNKRAEAYQRLFKMSIIFLVFLMIIGFFQGRGTISANIGNLLTLIILVIAGIYVIAEYYDIQRRDNMNFEEYDYGDANVGGGGGGDGGDGSGSKWGLCVNQNCCTDGMIFKDGKCQFE